MTNQEIEAARAKIIAELHAMPGPKPLKPIPQELKAELMRKLEWESYDEYTILMIKEMEEYGSYSGEEMLDVLDGKPVYSPHWL